MDLSIHTPNTLLIGLYTKNSRCVILGSLRHEDGELEEGIFDAAGTDHWRILAETLAEAKLLKCRNLIVFANDKTMVDIFTPPIAIPQDDGKTEKVWMLGEGKGKGYYAYIPCGGNVYAWRIIHTIFAQYNNFKFVYAEKLQKAEERWRQ